MSNLGLYQILTTTAKKCGGPLGFVVAVAAAGAVAGQAVIKATKTAVQKVPKKRR